MFKGKRILVFIVLISLLPLLSFFSRSLTHTHDGLVHLARIGAWYKALSDGQFPPRWAGDLNYGYGMPVLIFMYPLPYAVSGFFVSLGLGLVNAFKATLILSFVLSGVFMFLFAKELFKDNKKAFLVTILYQFGTFHLAEIITRGSFGEVWVYTFIPVILLGMLKIFSGQRKRGIFTTGLGTFFLLISHNSMSMAFFGAAMLFPFLLTRKTRDWIWAYASLFLGVGMSAFYWLVALWERKYTYGDLFMKDLYREHFPTIGQLFLPNFLNSHSGKVGNVPVQIGLIPLAGLGLSVFLLAKGRLKRREKKITIFSLIVFLISVFVMQPISLPLWERFSLLRQFQFSWRMLSLVVFVSSLSAFSFFHLLAKKKIVIWVIAILAIVTTMSYWIPPEGYDNVNEDDYWNYPLNTTYFGETDVIWSAGPAQSFPVKRYEVISGQGEITELVRNSKLRRFEVNAKTPVQIVERTQFFPGWKVYVDSQPVNFQFQDPAYRGLITFGVPEGNHVVEVRFVRTKDRIIAESISLLSLVVFGVVLLI